MAGLLGKAKTMRRRLSLAAAKTMGFKDALPPEIAVDDDELDALRKAHAALLKDVDDLGSGFSEHVAMLRDYYANGETLGDVAASSFRAERKRASSTLASASYFKRRSLRRCQNQLSSSSSRPRETGRAAPRRYWSGGERDRRDEWAATGLELREPSELQKRETEQARRPEPVYELRGDERTEPRNRRRARQT